MKLRFKIFVLTLLFFNAAFVQAQVTQVTASAGNTGMFDDFLVGDSNVTVIQSYLHEGKSYECAILQSIFTDQTGVDADDFRIFETSVKGPSGSNVSVTANGNIFPQMAKIKPLKVASSTSTSQQSRLRYSLIPTESGLHKFTTVDVYGSNGQDLYSVRCRETTIYGSYNRFFAQTAIVEIQNKAAIAIPVFITIVDAGGNVVVNKQSATANANTRTDIIFSGLPASNYGQIIITHTAPFGALTGVVAEYDQAADGSIVLKRERPLRTAQRS